MLGRTVTILFLTGILFVGMVWTASAADSGSKKTGKSVQVEKKQVTKKAAKPVEKNMTEPQTTMTMDTNHSTTPKVYSLSVSMGSDNVPPVLTKPGDDNSRTVVYMIRPKFTGQ